MTDLTPLGKESEQLVKTGQRYYVPNYKPREMILDHGKGARVWDKDGNEYIDLGAGIAVNCLGHAHPGLVNVLKEQADKLWHTSNIYFTEPAVKLSEALCETSFADRVFFCNSGGEANEMAIKLARKYSSQKYPDDKREIITFYGSFHGRTLTTVTATAQPKYQEGYEPLPGGFTYVDFNDEAAIEKAITDKTCAVLVEPIQGEGGITPAKPGFLKHVQDLCHKVDALLMLDEVQCGFGRTGALYAYMQYEGVEPDVMSLAKALGGGFPIGATLVGKKASEVMQFGSHGSTFGGNPMACAVALEILKHMQSKELMGNVAKQTDALRAALAKMNDTFSIFTEVRGSGLMIGAELIPELHGKAAEIMAAARRHGVMVLVAGPNVLRFLPPLNITDEELNEGIKRLHEAIAAYLN